MDLADVEAFAAVVQFGGFRAAAQATFTSQSTLSRQVKHLEEELGVPLLVRGPFGIKVTAHGAGLDELRHHVDGLLIRVPLDRTRVGAL